MSMNFTRAAWTLFTLTAASSVGSQPARQCIRTGHIVSRQPVAAYRLDLKLIGGRTARLDLAGGCMHLDEIDRSYTIAYDAAEGDKLCTGDRFRVIDPVVARAGGISSFPFCRITRITIGNDARPLHDRR